jgi:hypothetical protein
MEQIVQSTKQWTETKEERKARKARNKTGLSLPSKARDKNYVVCLKWGSKYDSRYVNVLHSMIKKHLTIEYEFVCFTENTVGINPGIRTEPLPLLPVQGWWYKPYFLSSELPISGNMLFVDLDVVIFNNINKLFTYEPERFCIIRDFNRSLRASWDKMNSSVFRVHTGKYHTLYEDFKKNAKLHMTKNRGDQDWMYRNIKDHCFWPDNWIQSYKWEMRDRNALKMVNGKRNFVNDDYPKILADTSIAVFHGDPNPADCTDSWVKANWK